MCQNNTIKNTRRLKLYVRAYIFPNKPTIEIVNSFNLNADIINDSPEAFNARFFNESSLKEIFSKFGNFDNFVSKDEEHVEFDCRETHFIIMSEQRLKEIDSKDIFPEINEGFIFITRSPKITIFETESILLKNGVPAFDLQNLEQPMPLTEAYIKMLDETIARQLSQFLDNFAHIFKQ